VRCASRGSSFVEHDRLAGQPFHEGGERHEESVDDEETQQDDLDEKQPVAEADDFSAAVPRLRNIVLDDGA
jgi:hypothetical protein